MLGWCRQVRSLNETLFSKVETFFMVGTINGPVDYKVISFDISQVCSALVRLSISIYGSSIYPPIFNLYHKVALICVDDVIGHCFVMVISRKCIANAT